MHFSITNYALHYFGENNVMQKEVMGELIEDFFLPLTASTIYPMSMAKKNSAVRHCSACSNKPNIIFIFIIIIFFEEGGDPIPPTPMFVLIVLCAEKVYL